MASQANWTARFEQTFTGPASAVRARIWQQVYGPEYPSWADPFSYVSVTELRRFARELHAAHGQCLVDAGCGRGGPGLWMAAVTGTRLIGIDLDEAALAAARRRADQAGMADRASFRRGSFHDTRLPDGSAQAVMSIDALLFAPSKPAAAAELARILAPPRPDRRSPAPAEPGRLRRPLLRGNLRLARPATANRSGAARRRHRTSRRVRRHGRAAAGTHHRDERHLGQHHPPRPRDRPTTPHNPRQTT